MLFLFDSNFLMAPVELHTPARDENPTRRLLLRLDTLLLLLIFDSSAPTSQASSQQISENRRAKNPRSAKFEIIDEEISEGIGENRLSVCKVHSY